MTRRPRTSTMCTPFAWRKEISIAPSDPREILEPRGNGESAPRAGGIIRWPDLGRHKSGQRRSASRRPSGKARMRIEKMHSWNVSPKEAQEIQLDLRKHWIGEDRLPAIRSVAGADVAFVLTGSQALRPRPTRSLLREANRAIAGVIVYRFPEMEEVERADAVRPLRFSSVPGLLSFR